MSMPRGERLPLGTGTGTGTGTPRTFHHSLFAGTRLREAPAPATPLLAVVVDTEEEFDWHRPLRRENTAVTAVEGVARAHETVFDRLGLAPTYVVDYPIAATPASADVFRDLSRSGAADIGTHLHPWVNPPHDEAVTPFNSYPGNLPAALEREKLRVLTQTITRAIGRRPTVYKAGRYGFGPATADILEAEGYTVDASITPGVSLSADGGPDFRRFPMGPFFFGRRERLLSLPVTSGFTGALRAAGPALHGPLLASPRARTLRVGGVLCRARLLEHIRLSPETSTLAEMQRLTRTLLADGTTVFTLTFHSPSLVPGHTPYVRTEAHLAEFLARIGDYAAWFRDTVGGAFVRVADLPDRLDAGGGMEAPHHPHPLTPRQTA